VSVNARGVNCVGFIPARLGSTRFPEKVLAARTGRPLIQHVWEAACRASTLSRVVIATDHERVIAAARAFGAETVLTRTDHPNGTSRIAEAASKIGLADHQVVVNVQGDEPELEPGVIDAAVEAFIRLEREAGARVGTAASVMEAEESADDPNIVKVVTDLRGRALYFSRSKVPLDRDARGGSDASYLRHIGVYVYRRSFLDEYVQLSSTPLERTEQLEQLRVLEHGHTIAVGRCKARHTGIDTPEQYEAFVQRWNARL